jgi:hypothetical protein
MCTCIAEIKASYTQVRKQAEYAVEKSYDIDDFLDAVNVVKKQVALVTDETNALVELVRNHFTEITVAEAEDLLALSGPIQKKMQQVYLNLLRSPLLVGMEQTVELYRQSMSDFDELCRDMRTFNVNLAQDTEFQRVSAMLNDLL